MQASRRDLSLVELFLDMLVAERGAAKNTIEAYRRDLMSYVELACGPGLVAIRSRH